MRGVLARHAAPAKVHYDQSRGADALLGQGGSTMLRGTGGCWLRGSTRTALQVLSVIEGFPGSSTISSRSSLHVRSVGGAVFIIPVSFSCSEYMVKRCDHGEKTAVTG